jgi:YbbR domain-containing protein
MSFRRLIHENFWLKLFSIILAIGLWFIIRPNTETEPPVPSIPVTDPVLRTAIELPVFVLTDPADTQIFKISPETVAVTITGEAAVLRKFSSQDFKAYLDLSEPRIPRTNHEVRLHVPAGVTVLNVLPRAVDIERISP